MNDLPSKPPLIRPPGTPFVVAVTGHRDLHPDDIACVQGQLTRTLQLITAALPHTPVHFLSALADGADQLFAAEVIALRQQLSEREGKGKGVAEHNAATAIAAARLSLQVPLPMPLASYCVEQGGAEFAARLQRYAAAADNIYTVPPTPGSDGYAALASHIEQRAHLVIAVWDGQTTPAASFPRKPGGTLDLVLRLLEARSGAPAASGVLHVYCRRAQASSRQLPPARDCLTGIRLLANHADPVQGCDAPDPRWPGASMPALLQWLLHPLRATMQRRQHRLWQQAVRDTEQRFGRRLDAPGLAALYAILQHAGAIQ